MNATEIRFCADYNLTSAQYAQLRRLYDRAARALVREHNTGTPSQPACTALEKQAQSLGINVRWDDGIYPALVKGHHARTLPDVS